MENEIIQLKDRFGALLNYLLIEGFPYELIEEKILRHPFFLFLEKNEASQFLKSPLETIIKDVFGKDVYLDYSRPMVSEFVWAGEMYIAIATGCDIPLQRVIMQLPIDKMLSLFNPYHEMSEAHLKQRFMEDFAGESIFKKLLDEKDIAVRKLSVLLEIKEKTLLSYQKNDTLFNASINNVYSLADYFNVPINLFLRHSNYSSFEPSLLEDELILKNFLAEVADYLGVRPEQIGTEFGKTEIYLDIEQMSITKKKRTYHLRKEEIKKLGKKAIKTSYPFF